MDETTWMHGSEVEVEVEEWRRFVSLLLLLVQAGRLDASDGVALVDAMGQPADVSRGRRALFAIVRRHEGEACSRGPARRS